MILAPIQGATCDLYRSTFAEHFQGVDYAVAPFLSTSSGDQIRPNAFRGLLSANNRAMPVIPQLLGNNSDHFILFVRHLRSLGYEQVNWNLGCPFPVVVKKQKGSGLLPHPERIHALIEKVIQETSIEMTVKLRLGFDCKEEIQTLIPMLNQTRIKQIIIHPRTGRQMYRGSVDLDVFEQCLQISKHPVVFNGDILDLETFNSLQNRFTNVNSWMIGRGILHNPFLAESIKGIPSDSSERVRRFISFYNDLYKAYSERLSGPGHLLNRMKEMWSYFQYTFEGGEKALKKLQKCRQKDHFEQLANQFLQSAVLKPQISDIS